MKNYPYTNSRNSETSNYQLDISSSTSPPTTSHLDYFFFSLLMHFSVPYFSSTHSPSQFCTFSFPPIHFPLHPRIFFLHLLIRKCQSWLRDNWQYLPPPPPQTLTLFSPTIPPVHLFPSCLLYHLSFSDECSGELISPLSNRSYRKWTHYSTLSGQHISCYIPVSFLEPDTKVIHSETPSSDVCIIHDISILVMKMCKAVEKMSTMGHNSS